MGSLFGGGGGKSAIFDAARTGDSKKLMDVLTKHPEWINQKDEFGNTAMHIAVDKNRMDIVKYLISKGADVNARDKDGRTPLYYLEMRPNEDLEDLLKKHGATI